jgi:hypothetical protein
VEHREIFFLNYSRSSAKLVRGLARPLQLPASFAAAAFDISGSHSTATTRWLETVKNDRGSMQIVLQTSAQNANDYKNAISM